MGTVWQWLLIAYCCAHRLVRVSVLIRETTCSSQGLTQRLPGGHHPEDMWPVLSTEWAACRTPPCRLRHSGRRGGKTVGARDCRCWQCSLKTQRDACELTPILTACTRLQQGACELTSILTVCTRPMQAPARQIPAWRWGDGHKSNVTWGALSIWLLCWREGQFPKWMTPWQVWHCVGLTPKSILETQIGLRGKERESTKCGGSGKIWGR